MTRDEARRRVIAACPAWSGAGTEFVDGLEALGLLKLEEPKAPEKEALDGVMVEMIQTVSLGQETLSGELSGRLTQYSAGCVIDALDAAGFRIVRA